MSAQQFKPHDSVKVKTGKRAGLVGVVEEVRAETGMVKVHINGVSNDEPIDERVWVKAAQLEYTK